MRLLRDADYHRIIKAENLEQIISDNTALLHEMELTARAEMIGYLSQRYRVNEIFTNTTQFSIASPYNAKSLVYYTEPAFDESETYNGSAPYNNATAYTIGQSVTYLGYIYTALGSTTGNLPTDATYWSQGSASPRVLYNGKIYEAITQTTGSLPTDTTSWRYVIDDKTLFYVDLPSAEWDKETSYEIGDTIFWQNNEYTAIQANKGLLPNENPQQWGTATPYQLAAGSIPTEGGEWIQGDNRNALIVTFMIDITLYHLLSRMPRNFSDIRKERYDGNSPNQNGGAIGWLKRVSKGEINADLPEIVETPQYRMFAASSRTKQSNFLW